MLTSFFLNSNFPILCQRSRFVPNHEQTNCFVLVSLRVKRLFVLFNTICFYTFICNSFGLSRINYYILHIANCSIDLFLIPDYCQSTHVVDVEKRKIIINKQIKSQNQELNKLFVRERREQFFFLLSLNFINFLSFIPTNNNDSN